MNNIKKIFWKTGGAEWLDWRWQMNHRLVSAAQLAELLSTPSQPARIEKIAQKYPFCVTPYYFSLCRAHDKGDPILMQFLPDARELRGAQTRPDPLGERRFEAVPGLLHRYRNRAVIIAAAECAVRCRHCTRKNTLPDFCGPDFWRSARPQRFAQRCGQENGNFPSVGGTNLRYRDFKVHVGRELARRRFASDSERPSQAKALHGTWTTVAALPPNLIFQRLSAILKYLRRHREIREVIVSGGDPLLLETSVLDSLLGELRGIKSIEVLRIGTRAPVVLPMRIDAELCACLKRHRPLWVNTQFNHPREITPESEDACRQMQEAGAPVSNQTVLLRGVNDSLAVLRELCNGLQRIMVRPYYVFLCDGVRGVDHFRTSTAAAAGLAGQLRRELGGLSMPLFVADIPGRKSKVPLETG